MFLEELAQQLKEHAARFDLENRAVEGCKQWLRNSLEEEAEETRFYLRGYTIEALEFQFVKHRLVFGSYRSWPHILSQVTFGFTKPYMFDNFGWYELETVEDGEISDDWFEWEQMRDERGRLIEFSNVRG